MNKLTKYSLAGGAVLLLLIVVAVIVLPYALNLDALRSWGEERATGYLGRDVTIEDVSFSWAGPKIRLAGFSVAENGDFGADPFARFDSFDLKLRFADLLRLRLSVEHVILSGPRIRILKNRAGRYNFDDILRSVNRPDAEASLPYAAMAPEGEGVEAPPIDLLVEEILMESGHVFYSDAGNPRLAKGVTLEGIEMTLRDLSLDRPMTVSAALGIERSEHDVELEGTAGPVGRVIVPGRIPFDLNMTVLPFEMERLPDIIGPLPVGLSGTVSASERIAGTLDGGITFRAQSKLSRFGLLSSGGKPLVRGFDGSVEQEGRVDLKEKTLSLDSFTLQAYKAVFRASGTVAGLDGAPTVDLSVRSNSIPLAGWEEVLPDLGPMLKLDGDLTFEGSVTGTTGKDLRADLSLASERFEMDRGPALMARSSSRAVVPPVGGSPVEPVKPSPIEVAGKVTVREGRLERIAFNDLSALMSLKGTVFSLDDLKLGAFSGRLAGSAQADLGTLPLSYGTQMMMTGVQVNEALAAVADLDGIVYGKASMDVSLQGKGTQFADLEKYLSGRGAVKAEDGRITTANLGGGAAKAASILGLGDSGGETSFENMDVSFTIENGKVKVGNMRVSTGEYTMKAQGDIGLDRSLDMTSRMTLSQEATARIPENRRALFPREKDGRVQIPLKVGGTVTSPRFGLDSSAMNQAAREEVKREVEEKKDELREKIQKDLGDRLKKLF